MFKSNVGGLDRMARVFLGWVLILLVFVGPKTPWGWLGLIPLLTGTFKFCPLYRLFGWNTVRKPERDYY